MRSYSKFVIFCKEKKKTKTDKNKTSHKIEIRSKQLRI